MDKKIELYHKLPSVLQNMAVSREGKKIKARRFDHNFNLLLEEYRRRLDYNEDLFYRFRNDNLKRFIKMAYEKTEYYRRILDENKINPDEISTIDDIKAIPVLTKEKAKSHHSEIENKYITDEEKFQAHTSGTTGSGLNFPITLEAEKHQWAVWWRYRIWHKIKMGTACAVFTGQPIVPPNQKRKPFWRTNNAMNEIIYSGYHLSEDNLPYYVEHLAESNISWIHGYPSNLAVLASFILNRRIDFTGKINIITTGAESLLSHQRKLIERAFGCKVRNHYGLAEGVANISECPEGRFHIDEDYAAIDLDPLGGGNYRVLGTNFTNPAFPLIRYDTGDIVYISPKEDGCLCGNPGRVVTAIDGRIEDCIVLRDGSKVGRMDHLFKDMVHIKEAQLVQKEKGKVIFRIVKNPEYTKADEEKLKAETSLRIGDQIDVNIDYVDKIDKSGRGKLRFVLNEIEGKKQPLELNL